MSTRPHFDYATFIALRGLDLADYMEPLLADRAATVSRDDLDRMLSELSQYDEYHLVYALTLGVKHFPQAFATRLSVYLAHEEASVWSTAFNSLAHLPGEYVTDDLVDSLRQLHSLYPDKPWITDALAATERRLGFAGHD